MGIVHCLSVASLRLEETDTLLRQGLLTSAGIIFSFAVEEYGKGMLFKSAWDGGLDPAPIEGFYDHNTKLEAAARNIPVEYLRLIASAFGAGDYGAGPYGGSKPVDLDDRLSGLYVDWKNGRWTHGVHVEPEVLAQSSRGLQAYIATAMIEWTMTN